MSQRVQDFLVSQGLSSQVKELPQSTRTAEEAAQAIGCSIAEIAKSLIFVDQITGHPVLIVASGKNLVNIHTIKNSIGLHLQKADAKFVKTRVGFVIGGVPPIAHLEKIKTLLDPTLKDYEFLWAAAGTPFAVFQFASKELERMTDGMYIDACHFQKL